MYLSEKPHPIDFYKAEEEDADADADAVNEPRDMLIEAPPPPPPPRDASPPKKRAETWAHDEMRTLIGLRRETDALFNTSKSNKHLWDQISARMRGKGFDRSPTMCTDKWRNLLKEFKKTKQSDRGGSGKMWCYKEIEEILRERSTSVGDYKSPVASKVDSFMHFSDKGIAAFTPSSKIDPPNAPQKLINPLVEPHFGPEPTITLSAVHGGRSPFSLYSSPISPSASGSSKFSPKTNNPTPKSFRRVRSEGNLQGFALISLDLDEFCNPY